MTVIFPEATKSNGNTSVTVAQSVADMSAPQLASEINAASSVNVSCFLYSGGVGTATTATGEAPARLCTTDRFQQFGNTTYEISELQYVYSPQGDPSADGNKAKAALTPGSTVYLIVRKGLKADSTAYAADQKVDVWKVQLGPQNRTQTGDGEYDEYSITQTAIVLGKPSYDAVIAA